MPFYADRPLALRIWDAYIMLCFGAVLTPVIALMCLKKDQPKVKSHASTR